MHAYLILAHNEPAVLERLIALLDYPDNDIYVHWDKKAGEIPIIPVSFSKLSFCVKSANISTIFVANSFFVNSFSINNSDNYALVVFGENTLNVSGKLRRNGKYQGYTRDTKKAVVTLTADSKKIEFFESMT